MATRKIAIVIKLEGANTAKAKFDKVASSQKTFALTLRQSNAEARRQEKHLQQLAIGAAKLSHAQNGLTNSFIKGNIAARAISSTLSGLGRAVKFGAKQFVDFQFSMAKIKAITGVTGENFKKLERKMRNIAAVSPKTAAEVANAGLAMGKLGLNSDELIDSLEGIIQTAVVLDESVDSVGETVVQVKNAYGLAASDIDGINEKLFTGISKSSLTLEKFSTAFSFVGAGAKGAGVDIGELIAVMGVLLDAGVKASTVGTQLRQVFVKLSDKSFKASQGIDGMTIKSDGLSAIIKKLNKDSLGTVDIYDQYGLRAISVVDVLQRMGGKFEDLKGKINGSTGALKKASGILSDTVAVSLKEVSSAFSEIAQSIGKIIEKPLALYFQGTAAQLRGVAKAIEGVRTAEGGKDPTRAVLGEFFDPTLDLNKKDTPITGPRADFVKPGGLSDEIIAAVKAQHKISDDLAKKSAQTNKEIEDAEAERLKRIRKLVQDIRTEQSLRALGVEAGTAQANIQTLLDEKAIGNRQLLLEVNTLLAALDKEVLEAKLAGDKLSIENLEVQRKKLIEIQKLSEDGLEIKNKEAELAQEALDASLEAQLSLKITKVLTDQLKSGVDAVSRAFANNLVNAVLSNKGAMIDFGNVFKQVVISMISQLTALIAKMLLFKAISFATGGIGGILPISPGNFTPLSTGLGLAADGFSGQVNRPTSFVTGEAGSEQISIRPKSAVGNSQSSSQQIIFQGPVYGMDDFVDKVNQANEQIERDFV